MEPGVEVPDLAKDDRVSFPGYGVGVVESVGGSGMRINWDKAGPLDHDRSFARHLTRL